MSCVFHCQISLLRTAVSFWALLRPAHFFSWGASASRQQNKREDVAQFQVFYQGGSEGVAWESSTSQFFQETCLTLSNVFLQCRFLRWIDKWYHQTTPFIVHHTEHESSHETPLFLLVTVNLANFTAGKDTWEIWDAHFWVCLWECFQTGLTELGKPALTVDRTIQ